MAPELLPGDVVTRQRRLSQEPSRRATGASSRRMAVGRLLFCFQEAAKLSLASEIGRIAAIQKVAAVSKAASVRPYSVVGFRFD
jgi:hypothetical protein